MMYKQTIFILLITTSAANFWRKNRAKNKDDLKHFRESFKPAHNYWRLSSEKNTCKAESGGKIVGGVEAVQGDAPWQVSIQSPNQDHFCGGSILDNKWILTAAHCVSEAKAYQLRVVAGEHNLLKHEGNEQIRQVDRIIVHEGFDSEYFRNDIALLKLSNPLTLNGYVVGHVCLPNIYQESQGKCTVSGWGTLSENSDMVSTVLNKVTVPIVLDTECIRSYWDILPIQRHMLCAGYPQGGKDSCQGDSGGPLVCVTDEGNFYLAGIVSFGHGCGQEKYFGVYTQVSYFVNWIEKNADINPKVLTFDRTGREKAKVLNNNEDYERSSSSKHVPSVKIFIVLVLIAIVF